MRTFDIVNRYLHLPVRIGAPMRRLTVASGPIRRTFDIELADGDVEWWAFIDLSTFPEPTVEVTVEGESTAAIDAIHQSDEIVGAEPLYAEARRPQLRFSTRRGWTNDPNGLVFHDGEYHLFYQHNPYGLAIEGAWGNAHWGHAVSTDLVHWTELPPALYPDALGAKFSGSAVVDWTNSSGLGRVGEPSLITIYTSTDRPFTQCIAVSTDRGRSLEPYAENPVLQSEGVSSRDPKVIWHARSGRWVMVLYLDRYRAEDHPDRSAKEVIFEINSYGVFLSDDLKSWTKVSEFTIPQEWECPEIFQLPVDGRHDDTRWIVFGGEGRYLIGWFDGRQFTPEHGPHVLSQGESFFASQTFTDVPVADGRRILIPWGRSSAEWPPPQEPVFTGMPFSQSMGLPVALTLRDTNHGLRLAANPVTELQTLRATTTRFGAITLQPESNPLADLDGELWEIELEATVDAASTLVFEAHGVRVVYDAAARAVSVAGRSAALEPMDGVVRLQIFIDRTAVDIFGNDGLLYMPSAVDFAGAAPALSLTVERGTVHFARLDVHQLTSAWAQTH